MRGSSLLGVGLMAMSIVGGLRAPPVQAQLCGCAPSDFDGDGDVDQEDFGHFQMCLQGPGIMIEDPSCLDARLDGDVDIDQDDLAVFSGCMAGPDIPYAGGEVPPVVITEFMASNGNTLTDEDGDTSDWIELYVPCQASVDLEHWYLTDNPLDLTKWRFPSVSLGRGQYLVVYASDKDRAIATEPLHTNFKLSSGGDYLALVMPDGATIAAEFAPQYPPQYQDVSYGLPMTLAGELLLDGERFFVVPTPAADNGAGAADLGPIISNVSHVPGLPADGDDLIVTAAVTASNLPINTVSMTYRVSFGSETGVAMVDDGGHGDGAAGDGVYGAIIPASDSTSGEMVRYYITATDTVNNVSRWPLYEDANESAEYLGTMIADPLIVTNLPVLYWFIADPGAVETETGTYASLFYDGEFYDNVFVRQRGGSAGYWPKKNFKFDFYKGHYFRYDDSQPRVEEINVQSTHSDKAYIRQVLAWETYEAAGAPYCVSFPMRVEQNGNFHSVAVFVEQPDERLLSRLGLDPDGALYKMYNQLYDAYSWVEKKTRLDEDHSDLQALIDAHMHGDPNRLAEMLDTVNIASVINYLAATTIMHDNDHVAKNYYLYRDTEGSGEWQMIPWDKDLTFGRNYVPGQADAVLNDVIWADDDSVGAGAPSHPLFGSYPYAKVDGAWNGLITAIHDVPELREMYLRRLRTLMNELLQPPGTPRASRIFEQRMDILQTRMSPDVSLDRSAWGNPYGADQDFATALGILENNYLEVRRSHLFNTHSTPGGGIIPSSLPGTFDVTIGTIDYNPATGDQDDEYVQLVNPNNYAVDISGWTISGAVDHTFEPGTVIRANHEMYVAADAAAFRSRPISPTGGEEHYVQGDYEGRLNARGETVVLSDANQNVVDSAGYPGSPSQAQLDLRITEIMYHPADPPVGSAYDDNDFEYIELRNIGPTTLDLTGVHFDDGVDFDFTGSAITGLAPGQYVLIVANASAFESRYGSGHSIAGAYAGRLGNAGENIRLADAVNEKILEFSYLDDWYPNTDGSGYSLVIVDDTAAWDTWGDAWSWRTSADPGGSPGQMD